MAVMALGATGVDLKLGDQWVIGVCVTDVDGMLTDVLPTLTITLPDGTTTAPAMDVLTALGVYRALYTVAAAGRYVARVVAAGAGVATFVAFVDAVTAGTAMPDLIDLRGDPDADPPTFGYLGGNSWTDDDIQDALDAEAASQRRVCRVKAEYDPDLRDALMRRVQRNLVMRGQPGVTVTDEGQPVFTPSTDPEVRRLERTHLRLVMG